MLLRSRETTKWSFPSGCQIVWHAWPMISPLVHLSCREPVTWKFPSSYQVESHRSLRLIGAVPCRCGET